MEEIRIDGVRKGKRFQKLCLCQFLSWFIVVADMPDVSAHPTEIIAFTNKNTLAHSRKHTREYNKSNAKTKQQQQQQQ